MGKKLIKLSSNICSNCKICNEDLFNKSIDDVANHYISKHDYTVEHIGQETEGSKIGNDLIHHTVMILSYIE